MAPPLRAPGPFLADSYPVGPSVETWRAMTPEAREQFLIEVNAAFSDPNLLMSEGRPHKRAKSRAADMLGLHFKQSGRVVYVAEEMSVVYPGEVSFAPDVLAVLDVEQPADDQRMSWVVADEGKGLDFVLEVLDRGDRRKDLTYNVERYARLGIPEYFVYDRAQQRVLGYRLGSAGAERPAVAAARNVGDSVPPVAAARRYERIIPQAGRYTSLVLGLDLAIQGGTLRFFAGMAELFGSDDLIQRLTGMVDSLEAKAARAAADAEEAAAKAAAATAKANEALSGLRGSIVEMLETRGLPVPEDAREQMEGCDDPATLRRWLIRALTAKSAGEALGD